MRTGTLIDVVAAELHENWRERMREAGVESRLSAWGEELMVSWSGLSKRAKDANRDSVRFVIRALSEQLTGGS